MANSNRIASDVTILSIKVVLFIAAIACSYYSEKNQWDEFIIISIIATIGYIALIVWEAFPRLSDLTANDNFASKIALSALPSGVTAYFNMQNNKEQDLRNSETIRIIERAQDLILCANSGASYLDHAIYRHWPAIEKRLQQGVNFRVVLLDPTSEEKAARNKLNNGIDSYDSKINLANLINLYNNNPTFDLKFTRIGMHATVFATEDNLIFDPYHLGATGNKIDNRSFCLIIKAKHKEKETFLYRQYKSHFHSLWNNGTSIEEWLQINASDYQGKLPAIKSRK